ncbi:MAG: ATP-dependent 6-phosphofructokinase [Oscillospiraceae bacterium]|nr:ATP-dependent 6-phosphofructokinase [Oscillospiraceae bacterium]
MKAFGILTSGGDCPGMNPTIRAAVFAAYDRGIRLYGVQRGFLGLHESDWKPLTPDKVDGIHRQGGTMLRTARFAPFLDNAARQPAIDRCVANCKSNLDAEGAPEPIEGLIVIGGDGSFRGASDLSKNGLPCVCLPGTIDNDISCTDYTIGFDTCLNTVTRMADTIADTSRSHDRCTLLEVMGNKAGDLALYGGIAAGATGIFIMEHGGYPEDGEMSAEQVEAFHAAIIARVDKARAAGKNYAIILIAEGITGKKLKKTGTTRYPGGIQALAGRIQALSGMECRADVLGYVQRGGNPSARDRIIGSQMGVHAVDLLARGEDNRIVVLHKNTITDIDITMKCSKQLSQADIRLAQRVSL